MFWFDRLRSRQEFRSETWMADRIPGPESAVLTGWQFSVLLRRDYKSEKVRQLDTLLLLLAESHQGRGRGADTIQDH